MNAMTPQQLAQGRRCPSSDDPLLGEENPDILGSLGGNIWRTQMSCVNGRFSLDRV